MSQVRARGVLIVSVIIVLLIASTRVQLRAQSATGGFVESALSTLARPVIPGGSFLPSRGPFTFPAPYGTAGVRLTNPSDCGGGDCVAAVGYSYWRNINNHVGSNRLLIAITLLMNRGGTGPTLFSYDKTTGETQNLGPIFDPNSALAWGSGEGWYFSGTRPHALYVNDGPRMVRYDVISKSATTVFDVRMYAGANRSIWQMHSSADDNVHSFTVKDASSSADLGCGVFIEDTQQYKFFPARGYYDECQIDRSGRYLVIKMNADGRNAEENVVEDLSTGAEWILTDEAGALGHSDVGFGYAIGEDNWNHAPGAIRLWQYGGGITNGRLVYQGTSWDGGSTHVSHTAARRDVPIDQNVACNSNVNRSIVAHSNEIVCYRLDGSMQVLVVAPVMTDLDAAGGGDDYGKSPKGNLDVTGEYFVWTSNMGSGRLDAFVVRVPLDKLGVAAGTGTSPTPTPTPAPAPTPAPIPAPPESPRNLWPAR